MPLPGIEMKIQIIDPHNLAGERSILIGVIQNHPLCPQLPDRVKTIVFAKSHKESIEYDLRKKNIVLNLSISSHKNKNYKYVLFHEFSHVADKINSEFKYSDQLKNSLADKENILLMELWNVYIDSRLNYHGLFMLGPDDANVYARVNRKLQKLPFTIEGKVLGHISFLSSRGFREAKFVVEEIWNNPQKSISYVHLIQLVKQGLANNALQRMADSHR